MLGGWIVRFALVMFGIGIDARTRTRQQWHNSIVTHRRGGQIVPERLFDEIVVRHQLAPGAQLIVGPCLLERLPRTSELPRESEAVPQSCVFIYNGAPGW